MADGEYKRLCSVTECGGTHKAQGYCLRHYRQWQRGGVKQDVTNCGHCGEAFTPSQVSAMYCTKRCKRAAWAKADPERYKALPSNQRKVSAIHAGYCTVCGDAYVGRRERLYCGPKCEPRAGGYALGLYYTPAVRTCPHCSLTWSAIRQIGVSPYCQTPACQDARRKELRKARSNKSHIDRAKKHGRRYGYFNVMRVFKRDGWRCQLCGVKTPKSLRGTMDPKAPEIDHIVPISLGGDHLIENCQCACRQCNGTKHAKAAGQLWLLGFADTR